MRAQPGHRGVGVGARDLELDVAVELVEAGVAVDLGAAGPSSRSSACSRSDRFMVLLHCFEREPALFEMFAQLLPRVVHGLVERAAIRAEPLGEHVDRNAVQRERDEHAPLMRRQPSLTAACNVVTSSFCSASAAGPRPALERASQPSGSSGISRPCHERLRNLTAAS